MMNKPIRILMGVPSKKIKMGGPTTHLPYLVDYFKKNKEYRIETFDYGSKIDGGSLVDKKETIASKFLNSLQVFFLFICRTIVFRPHIIHINSAFDKRGLIRDVPFSLICYLLRKKLIFKLHGSSYDLINTKSRFYIFLIKLFFLGSKKVGVLSEIEKREFIAKFGYSNKVVVVKNIVTTKELNIKEGFSWFEKDPSKIYGLFVSRIVKGKGLSDLIQALPSILSIQPNFVLVIAGDGPEKDLCINIANNHKVNDSIIWLGFVSNKLLPKLISHSDIYIFSSHLPEGMPMSLVEALQSGIPIITTRVRFAVNYLAEYKNCLFIEAGNINDIAEKTKELIKNKELQIQMKQANPKLVEKFSEAIVGKEFEILYQQILKKDDGEKVAVKVLNNNDATINSFQ